MVFKCWFDGNEHDVNHVTAKDFSDAAIAFSKMRNSTEDPVVVEYNSEVRLYYVFCEKQYTAKQVV